MKRTLTRAAVTVLTASGLMLLLTGCLKMDIEFSIEEDQTVNGTMLLAMEASTMRMLGMDPTDAFAEQDESFNHIDGVTATPYDDGTWIGTEYTFNQVSLDDFNADAASNPEAMRIIYDAEAGTYEFRGVADFAFEGEFDETGMDAGPDMPEFEAFWSTFEAVVKVTFPGKVIDHNGEVSGTTVTWTPQAGERTELYALAHASGGGLNPASVIDRAGSSWWWIVVVGLLVALGVVVLVIVLVLRGRRTPPAAPAPMYAAPPPHMPPPPGGAPAPGMPPSPNLPPNAPPPPPPTHPGH
jgi:hypothetical protein